MSRDIVTRSARLGGALGRVVVCYALVSFADWHGNPLDWSDGARWLAVVLYVAMRATDMHRDT